MRLHSGTAAGPDGVLPRVLKACAPQLCGVLSQVFNLSLHLQRVPVLWKTSCLVPVPKTLRPSGPQDYRPVALTSHIMKTLERLVLEQLRPMVRPFTDPLQFTYQPRLGVEDVIIYLLNRVYTHLDKPTSTVRVMFLFPSMGSLWTLLRNINISGCTSIISWTGQEILRRSTKKAKVNSFSSRAEGLLMPAGRC